MTSMNLQVGERHDAVMSSLGLPPELIKRLRQKSKEHKQLSGLFKRADWEQVKQKSLGMGSITMVQEESL